MRNSELCEPCGECEWCFRRHKMKHDRARFMRVAQDAINAIDAGFPPDPVEEKANRTYRKARAAMYRLQNALDLARRKG